MPLERYRQKRHFQKTPEPRGQKRPNRAGRVFVIQKHAARRLHYDFRLELDGVLVSWAVPKGPSLDPKERRLAVHVEDHPVEYGNFEGVIPAGEYGGGTVLLWDRGRWTEEGDAAEGLRRGKLKFRLDGEKLRGGWTLVRMGGRVGSDGKENWLLIKEDDDEADSATDVLAERPESVASGRDLDEIRARQERTWHSNRPTDKNPTDRKKNGKKKVRKKKAAVVPAVIPGARKAKLPARIAPQLATLVQEVPDGEGWLHEIKYDGYRVLCRIASGRATLLTREGKDWTVRFATVAADAQHLAVREALLDGEVAAIESDGRTSFQALQNALSGDPSHALAFFAFDLLHLDGYDLTHAPLTARKEALAGVLSGAAPATLRYSDHFVGHGRDLYDHACRLKLEGIIAKRADSPYRPGRGRDWLKIKCLARQEFVIVGFTEPAGSRSGLGALLVAVHDAAKELVYSGRVGTGFDAKTLRELRTRLQKLEQDKPAVVNPPRGAAARGIHWVRPTLVAEIEFTEWTRDRMLRHPSFKGLREDKPAGKIVREKPQAAEVAGVRLTNPDRIVYPDAGITKLELVRYYETVAEWMLPRVADRPLMLLRCPEGQGKPCFYQKHSRADISDAVKRVRIREDGGSAEYLAVDTVEGLVSLVQLGTLEFHCWGSRTDRLTLPDQMIFDLDPDPELPWKRVVETAALVRSVLTTIGLAAFLKTTGGKGLHVVVPLARRQDWEEVKEFSRALAELIVRHSPKQYTTVATKARRVGKIYIDYLRNARGATAIAAYSTRARPGAPVSAPIGWDELDSKLRSDSFDIRNLPGRLERLARDPWEGWEAARRPITAAMKRAVASG